MKKMLKEISEKDLKTIIPNNSDIVLENISENLKNNYIELYNMYRSVFTEFIIKKLDLKRYDDEIENSGLKFKKLEEKDMDIYQYFSCDKLRYLYIRNNIYVEKLNKEEKEFFENKIKKKDFNLDDNAKKIIEDTYKKVIFENVLKNGERCHTFFGPNSSNFLARNDEVVIGIRYDDYFLGELSDDEWVDLHDRQMIYLNEILEEMATRISKTVDISVSILRYDEFSVVKRI